MGAIVLYWAVTTLVGTVWSGPLDPPAAPAETQRTQITSLPFTISSPGSYVVMADLTCTACGAGASGITVAAEDVTIDFNGFAIRGVAGSGDGIVVTGSRTGVAVRNGFVNDWTGKGINFTTCSRCRVEDLDASDNSDVGVHIGASSIVSNVMSTGNSIGIMLNGHGNVLRDSIVEGGIFGIWVALGSNGNLVEGNVVRGASTGVMVSSNENSILGNISNLNAIYGFSIDGDANSIVENSSNSNSNDGFRINGDANSIVENSADSDSLDGFVVTGVGNSIVENSSNNVNVGFDIGGAGNLVVRNIVQGVSVLAFQIGGGNTVGLLETGTPFNPWANIAH